MTMEAHEQVVSELEAHRTGDVYRNQGAALYVMAPYNQAVFWLAAHNRMVIRELPSMLWRPKS